MHATSDAQFAAAEGGGLPPLERVRDDVWALGVPLPGTLPHFTLSYLILDDTGGVNVIDPGWDSEENWGALQDALALLGRGAADIASVTVTHLHPDHLGMAARVRAASGAPVALHRLEQDGIRELTTPIPDAVSLARFADWGAPDDRHPELLDAVHRRSAWKLFTADRLLEDGDRLDIPGRELRVLHTPGHTTGHLAIVDVAGGLVFTGDLLLPNQFPGIGLGGTPAGDTPAGGPIEDYLRSLDLVARYDDHEALPGHGYRFTGIAERCRETAAHHERRTSEVAAALGDEGTVWSVASGLTWTAGWENLRGFALLSALAQTALHTERARRISD